MSKHYMMYWLPQTVEDNLRRQDARCDHAAGEQLEKVAPNDVLWFVTAFEGRLHLVGRMQVGQRVTEDEALNKLGTEDLWSATWHVFARDDTSEPFNLIDITEEAQDLRFQSRAGRDRLSVRRGKVSPQQLQAMRLLTPHSARVLDEIWYDHQDVRPVIEESEPGELPARDFQTYREGKRIERMHYSRERSRSLVRHAKVLFLGEHGSLFCEACDFEFSNKYGEHGQDYIEAHHDIPMSEFDEEREVTINELRMVCANCHRMIHRYRPWLTVEELKRIIAANQL